MRMVGLPVFAVQPAEEGVPVAGGCQQAAFAGQFAGVPGGVAAERGQRVMDVVENQGQGAEGESDYGNRHAAQRNDADNLFGKNRQEGHAHAGDHPCCQSFIPHREAQEEASPGEPAVAALLVEAEQQQHAADEQQVLQGDRTPVETDGQQIK